MANSGLVVEKNSIATALCIRDEDSYLSGFSCIDNEVIEMMINSGSFNGIALNSVKFLLKNKDKNNIDVLSLIQFVAEKITDKFNVFLPSELKNLLPVLVNDNSMTDDKRRNVLEIFCESVKNCSAKDPAVLGLSIAEIVDYNDRVLFESLDGSYGKLMLSSPDYINIALCLKKDILVESLEENSELLDVISSITPRYNYLYKNLLGQKFFDYFVYISKQSQFYNHKNTERNESLVRKLSKEERILFLQDCSWSLSVLMLYGIDLFTSEELTIYLTSNAFDSREFHERITFLHTNYTWYSSLEVRAKLDEMKEFLLTKEGVSAVMTAYQNTFERLKINAKAYNLGALNDAMRIFIVYYRKELVTKDEYVSIFKSACEVISKISSEKLIDSFRSFLDSCERDFSERDIENLLPLAYNYFLDNNDVMKAFSTLPMVKGRVRMIKKIAQSI